MRAERLTRAAAKGARDMVGKLTLDAKEGVLGDYKSAQDGSVSLLSGEAEARIRAAGGLCTDRFSANIVTRGLDYSKLRAGSRLSIGETELEIARVGKSCFAACALFQQGEPCPLPASCAFAYVRRSGKIRAGDEIRNDGA